MLYLKDACALKGTITNISPHPTCNSQQLVIRGILHPTVEVENSPKYWLLRWGGAFFPTLMFLQLTWSGLEHSRSGLHEYTGALAGVSVQLDSALPQPCLGKLQQHLCWEGSSMAACHHSRQYWPQWQCTCSREVYIPKHVSFHALWSTDCKGSLNM